MVEFFSIHISFFSRYSPIYRSFGCRIPVDSASAIWGRAWEENGGTKALFIYRNKVVVLERGYRLLMYRGAPDTNGYKFLWMRVKDADHGTVLFSGANMHVPAVYVEDGHSEYLGDADWQKKVMEYVKYGSCEPHTVANYGGYHFFDEEVYVLTKQRCNCQC